MQCLRYDFSLWVIILPINYSIEEIDFQYTKSKNMSLTSRKGDALNPWPHSRAVGESFAPSASFALCVGTAAPCPYGWGDGVPWADGWR
jgi:hypothetical protein